MAQNHQYNPNFVSRQASDITIINRFPPVYSNPQRLNLGLQNSNFVTIPNQQLAAMAPSAKVLPGSQIQSFRPWRPAYCPAAATNQLIGSQVGSTMATTSKAIHTGLPTGEPTSRNAGTIAGNMTGPIHSVNRKVIATDGDVAKLQSTVARQRSLIAKLIAALVQDRLKQSTCGLGLDDGEKLCSEADQLLTYAPRPLNAVPRSFASDNAALERRADYSSDHQRHQLLPISKKKRRRKHTDEKKKHRKRICHDRKFTSSPKEILSSDGNSPNSCCSRHSKSTSKHRRYRCQHEDRISTDCDDDFERLRQRALELMDPKGDSRLFSLRSAVSNELTSLAIAIKRAKSNIKSPTKNEAAPRTADGDWAPPSASTSDASTLRMSSVTSSASTQVHSSEGGRRKRNHRRRVMRRRKVYSRRLRRSHNRSKPSIKRKASHEAKKKIDSIQRNESSEDPEDCAIRAIQQSRALWVDMTKNNAAFHKSRRMVKCRSTLTTVERKLDSCESCTTSDDPEVQRINTEALQRFNQLLKSERLPEGKKIDNMYLISRYLSASMTPNSKTGQNQRFVASPSGDCQAKLNHKKADDKHETDSKPEKELAENEIHKEAVTAKLDGSSSDIFEDSIVASPDVIGQVVTVDEGQHTLEPSDRQPPSSTPDQDRGTTKLCKSTTTDIIVTEVRSLRDCFEPLSPPRGDHDVTPGLNVSSAVNCEEPAPAPPQLVEKFRALNERFSPTKNNESSPQASVQDDSFGEDKLYIAEESYVEAKREPLSPEPLLQPEPTPVVHFSGDKRSRTSVVKAAPCYDSDPLPKVAHESKAWPTRKLDDSGEYFPSKHLKPALSSGASSPCSFGAFSIDDPVELSLVPRRASCKAKERIQEQLCLESSRGMIAATHHFAAHRHTHSCSPVAVRTRNSLKPPTKESGQREVKFSSSDDDELPPLPWKTNKS